MAKFSLEDLAGRWWKVISAMSFSPWAARGEAAVSHCHWLESLGGVRVQSPGNQQHWNRRAKHTLQKGPHQRNAYVSATLPPTAAQNSFQMMHFICGRQQLDSFKELFCASVFHKVFHFLRTEKHMSELNLQQVCWYPAASVKQLQPCVCREEKTSPL